MSKNNMAKFDIFIGTWNTQGEVFSIADAPATSLSATDTYRWLPGKHFIVHDVDARFGAQVSRSMEVMGYDLQRRRYVSRSYDDQGISESFELELNRRRWRIFGQSVRFDGSFNAPGDKLSGTWEMKTSKSKWQPWIEIELTRA